MLIPTVNKFRYFMQAHCALSSCLNGAHSGKKMRRHLGFHIQGDTLQVKLAATNAGPLVHHDFSHTHDTAEYLLEYEIPKCLLIFFPEWAPFRPR